MSIVGDVVLVVVVLTLDDEVDVDVLVVVDTGDEDEVVVEVVDVVVSSPPLANISLISSIDASIGMSENIFSSNFRRPPPAGIFIDGCLLLEIATHEIVDARATKKIDDAAMIAF